MFRSFCTKLFGLSEKTELEPISASKTNLTTTIKSLIECGYFGLSKEKHET